MQQMQLDHKIREVSARIRALREEAGLSAQEMAEKTGVTANEYIACEEGRADLTFAFIYRCATAFRVDVTDLIEGESPNLHAYTVTRRGDGQRIEQAHGMTYFNLAPSFKNRISEPLFVHAAYDEEAQRRPIECTTHAGQECDIVIKGRLKVQIGDHVEVLGEGDAIYYDSSAPHGMITDALAKQKRKILSYLP